MIRAMDQFFGEMLAVVDLSNTYIFFLSDNGTPNPLEMQPCPPGIDSCAKHTVYEPGIRVPAFVFGPGIIPGRTDAVLSCVDVMATIADILEVKNPGKDSISFAPLFDNSRAAVRRFTFSEIFENDTSERAVIGQRYKLRTKNDTYEWFYDLTVGEIPTTLDPEIEKALRDVLANPLDVTLQEF
jgi:arylsulfatase A-like enzyme